MEIIIKIDDLKNIKDKTEKKAIESLLNKLQKLNTQEPENSTVGFVIKQNMENEEKCSNSLR